MFIFGGYLRGAHVIAEITAVDGLQTFKPLLFFYLDIDFIDPHPDDLTA